MENFEKLGAFYLGKAYDLKADALLDQIVLYDAKDLTTHAVIIGMTGSGKTGLGIGILEEAALDHIPVIAIDPKGDLGNLLLTFPDLRPEDFKPWVNEREATDRGMTPDAYAEKQAELWKNGLSEWGQTAKRIKKLRESADFAIYTPGSSAGLPVSVLRSFSAPSQALREDKDLYRERIQSTATSILALLGIDADPITSKEHILIANLLEHAWGEDRSLDLGGLIAAIQQPPMKRIGVMEVDTLYPAKERFALAMKLNNLLAAPGFGVWMEGAPLNAAELLHSPTGKPRVSVMSIAHLADAERMFFVSMLLNEVIAWMRAQSGTATLRAILYMDEIFGYMPPTAAPPSKHLLLTLLKQARAYGLGLVLATQNPVDLDYKGLSNTGTWFIGRLQTERDKARVMEGLEGAAAGGSFDKQRMEQVIAGLGKRKFLLHNVHEDEPVVFNTRWVMSYLPGPFTREQIRTLMADKKASQAETTAPVAKASPAAARAPAVSAAETRPPVLPPGIEQYFLPVRTRVDDGGSLSYFPRLIVAADVAYSSARYNVNERRSLVFSSEVEDGPVPLSWDSAERLDLDASELEAEPAEDATFAECPDAARQPKNIAKWSKAFNRWLRAEHPLTLYRSPSLKLVSTPGESLRDFRVRLQTAANEQRDIEVEKLRNKYASKTTTLEERLRRAEQAIEREAGQSRKKKLDVAISVGTAILGAVLGRKRLSSTSASRMGTAVKGIGGLQKEAGDVARAKETAEAVRAQLRDLEAEFEKDVEKLGNAFDAQSERLEEILVKPKITDVHVQLIGIGWFPFARAEDGRLSVVWAEDSASP